MPFRNAVLWLLGFALSGALLVDRALAQKVPVYGEISRLAAAGEMAGEACAPLGKGEAHASEMWAAPQTASWELPTWSEMLWPVHWRHTNPADPQRHVGVGKPLVTSSWRNRPFHIGWLFGGLLGDPLIAADQLKQDDDMFGGYRLGWDFDHYWGTELRFGFAHMSLIETRPGERLPTVRDHFWDLNLLYYPWGDARWRPFATVGVGAAAFRLHDRTGGLLFDDILFAVPFGGGVKFYYRPWLALRFDVIDYYTIRSQGLDSMHNVSLTAGVEVHFGGPRRSYFPYDAGAFLW